MSNDAVPTLAAVKQMTPEEQKALHKKLARMLATKIVVGIIVGVAVKIIFRYLEIKLFGNDVDFDENEDN
jgi:flagellar biosynthesis protein FliR